MRQGTMLQRAGTHLQRVGSNLGLQRADSLPTEDRELRHAATMPLTHDGTSQRPFCCGMWKVQQFLGFLGGVSALLLLCVWRPIGDYPKANDMLGLTVLCGLFLVCEVMPIYITALLPVVMMPLLQITSTQVAAQAYWNMIQMLVVGTYLVNIALEEVQLPRRAALKLLLATGVVQPALLLFSFMLLSWLLSMFCNTIAVTLMITPFATGLMNAAEERAWDEAAEAAATSGDSEAHFEGEHGNETTQEVQRFADGLLLGIAYSATAGGIATLTGAIPNEVLTGIDLVGSHVSYRSWLTFALPTSMAVFGIAYVVLYVRYVRGLVLRTLTHEILEAEYEELVKEIGHCSRDELFVGLIQALQFVLLFVRPFVGRMLATDFDEVLIGDSTLACLPVVLLFFVPSSLHPGKPVLTWPAIHEKFDFGLLLLIGGGFAISSGFTQSGLNIALGQGVLGLTRHSSPFVLNLQIVILCTVATQVFSAVGTATTVLPILDSAALSAVYHPLALLLPATVACSFAFMLPTATPANVVVLAKSQALSRPLRVRDFFLTGLPLNLAAIAVGSVLIYIMGHVVFEDGGPFPKWACDGVSCIWLPLSGFVRGRHVAGQACVISDAQQLTCQLWNGTLVDPSTYLDTMPA